MELRHKPELQDRLAAEYVLGTLRGSARARFQRMLREDASLRIAVEAWQSRLIPLASAVEPVDPPRRVWEGIQARTSSQASAAESSAGGLWNSLAFWRNLGLFRLALLGGLFPGFLAGVRF